jgi:peptidyl-prolyl cis-trans isomerase C
MLIERECAAPEPMDADCRRYFNQNPERFRTPDLHEVSHILFPAPNPHFSPPCR